MLRKLLKYDLKWCLKPLVVFYALALFFAITTRVLGNIEESLIVLIISRISSGILIAMIFNILINCFMRNWARFIRNLYKDESYLIHTLPVDKSTIYLSKILTVIICLLISFIAIIICLSIAYLDKNSFLVVKETLEQSAVLFNSSVSSLVVVLIITVFFEFLFMQMAGILGIIIGHSSNNLKIVKSIILGFGIYIILSISSVAILYVAGLLNPDIMSIFNSVRVNSSTMKLMMIIGILMYAIYNLLVYFIGDKLLRKGVNID